MNKPKILAYLLYGITLPLAAAVRYSPAYTSPLPVIFTIAEAICLLLLIYTIHNERETVGLIVDSQLSFPPDKDRLSDDISVRLPHLGRRNASEDAQNVLLIARRRQFIKVKVLAIRT